MSERRTGRNEERVTGRLSRRALLQRAAGALGACALSARAADIATTLPALATRASTGPIDAAMKSAVAHVRAEEVISGSRIHPALIGEMIEEGIKALTGKTSGPAAWREILRDDDVIGIKFNHVAAEALATTPPFAAQLLESLGRAGFDPGRIMLIEVPTELARSLKARPAVTGWSGGKVAFAGGEEELSAALQEVTALINVPFLKTHNIAGMTGCLKNLSHALIRRPGRYHANACSPYVADIVALPQIRSKLRLHIMNALRAVFDGGPEATIETSWAHRGVLVSRDPVAIDSVGTDLINDRRARARLAPIGDASGRIPHLRAAVERNLGTDDQDYITLLEPSAT